MFKKLCRQAFTKRFLGDIPFVKSQHHSKYKSKELEKALQEVFENQPIFGGKRSPESPTRLNVGVVSTSSNGVPCLHANYNRAQSVESGFFFYTASTTSF
jgi:3'-phosphoadenosine 5'-phosphosulfate sulfotransferase (PAPS reductase)/FAD synthetase